MSEPLFYLTTPIYYVNALPHLGHAYTTILGDAFARYYRQNGYRVFYLTGTDEHGDKIMRAAEKEHREPQVYADRIAAVFKQTWQDIGITNDRFIRTTEPQHIAAVQEFLNRVHRSGDIYFGKHGGHYCTGCERFYTEKEWQLRQDRKYCPDHQKELEFIEEENYFFTMEKYRPWLADHISSNPAFIQPERYRNEILSMLNEPIGDLCISRPRQRISWGIPLPFDDRFVTYVWFDALINYVSGLGWPSSETFDTFWPVAEHIIAKDILKPHAVFWPLMLKSAGLPLYKKLHVHGYWLMDTSKMSKSLDNVVRPVEMGEKYGHDVFRYFLLRDMSFGLDTDYREENLVNRLNYDLADDLGNLFSRTVSMAHKYFAGVVPQPGEYLPADREIITDLDGLHDRVSRLVGQFSLNKSLEEIWKSIKLMNKYIDYQAPWTLFKKNDCARLATVIYCGLEALRVLAAGLNPVLPDSCGKMRDVLGDSSGTPKNMAEQMRFGKLAIGRKLQPSIILFRKLK